MSAQEFDEEVYEEEVDYVSEDEDGFMEEVEVEDDDGEMEEIEAEGP